MCLKHNWMYYGPETRGKLQYRQCDKCSKTESLHHLLHMGFELYFYKEENIQPPYEEIKSREKNSQCLIVVYTMGSILFFLSTFFLDIAYIQIGMFSIPIILPLFVLYLVGGFILVEWSLRIWKLYSISVAQENKIAKFYPVKKERRRETQIRAEKLLMFKLANNEISKEEFTARMARL